MRSLLIVAITAACTTHPMFAPEDIGGACDESCVSGLSCFNDYEVGEAPPGSGSLCFLNGPVCSLGCNNDSDCTNAIGSGFYCYRNCNNPPYFCRATDG